MVKDQGKQSIELTVMLSTEKGTRYVAGVIKLLSSELLRQEGEILMARVTKCVDMTATCELRVDSVEK